MGFKGHLPPPNRAGFVAAGNPGPAGPLLFPSAAKIQLRAQWSQPAEDPWPLQVPASAPPRQCLLLFQPCYCLGFSRIRGHGIKSHVQRDVYEWGLRALRCSNTGLDRGQKRVTVSKSHAEIKSLKMQHASARNEMFQANLNWNPTPSKVKRSSAVDLSSQIFSQNIQTL